MKGNSQEKDKVDLELDTESDNLVVIKDWFKTLLKNRSKIDSVADLPVSLQLIITALLEEKNEEGIYLNTVFFKGSLVRFLENIAKGKFTAEDLITIRFPEDIDIGIYSLGISTLENSQIQEWATEIFALTSSSKIKINKRPLRFGESNFYVSIKDEKKGVDISIYDPNLPPPDRLSWITNRENLLFFRNDDSKTYLSVSSGFYKYLCEMLTHIDFNSRQENQNFVSYLRSNIHLMKTPLNYVPDILANESFVQVRNWFEGRELIINPEARDLIMHLCFSVAIGELEIREVRNALPNISFPISQIDPSQHNFGTNPVRMMYRELIENGSFDKNLRLQDRVRISVNKIIDSHNLNQELSVKFLDSLLAVLDFDLSEYLTFPGNYLDKTEGEKRNFLELSIAKIRNDIVARRDFEQNLLKNLEYDLAKKDQKTRNEVALTLRDISTEVEIRREVLDLLENISKKLEDREYEEGKRIRENIKKVALENANKVWEKRVRDSEIRRQIQEEANIARAEQERMVLEKRQLVLEEERKKNLIARKEKELLRKVNNKKRKKDHNETRLQPNINNEESTNEELEIKVESQRIIRPVLHCDSNIGENKTVIIRELVRLFDNRHWNEQDVKSIKERIKAYPEFVNLKLDSHYLFHAVFGSALEGINTRKEEHVLEIVKLFISLGVDLSLSDKHKNIALFIACHCGYLSVIKELLDANPDSLYHQNKHKANVLMYLCMTSPPGRDMADIARFLLEKSNNSLSCNKEHKDLAISLLFGRYNNQDEKGVRIFSDEELLEINNILLSVSDLSILDDYGNTVLIRALNTVKDIRVIESILDKNSNLQFINHRNQDGYDAVIIAASQDNMRALKLLLDKGANYKNTYKYNTTLLIRVISNIKNIDKSNMSYRHLVVEFLLDNGVDINAVDDFNKTALQYSTQSVYGASLSKILLSKGASINIARETKWEGTRRETPVTEDLINRVSIVKDSFYNPEKSESFLLFLKNCLVGEVEKVASCLEKNPEFLRWTLDGEEQGKLHPIFFVAGSFSSGIRDKINIIRLFKEKGVDLKSTVDGNGNNILYYVSCYDKSFIERILFVEPSLVACTNYKGQFPVVFMTKYPPSILASQYDGDEILSFLLKKSKEYLSNSQFGIAIEATFMVACNLYEEYVFDADKLFKQIFKYKEYLSQDLVITFITDLIRVNKIGFANSILRSVEFDPRIFHKDSNKKKVGGVDEELSTYKPIHILADACSFGHVEIVESFYSLGYLSCLDNEDLFTVISGVSMDYNANSRGDHLIQEKNRIAILKILQKAGINIVEYGSENGYKFSDIICFAGYDDMLKFVMEEEYKVENSTNVVPTQEDEVEEIISYCKNGFFKELVAALKENKSLINYVDEITGETLLHHSCKSGNIDIVDYLVENGLDIDAVTKKGLSPLLVSCNYGQFALANHLLEKYSDKIIIDRHILTKENVFHFASRSKCFNNIEKEERFKLFKNIMNSYPDLRNSLSNWGIYPFDILVGCNDDFALTKLFLEAGVKLDHCDGAKNKVSVSSFLFNILKEKNEVSTEDYKIIGLLIDYGSNPYFREDKDMDNAIQMAKKSALSGLETFLEERHNRFMARKANDETFRRFLSFDIEKYGPQSSFKEKVRRMVGNVKLDTINSDGNTLMHLACIDKNKEWMQFLFECNSSINIKNNRGITAAQIAKENGEEFFQSFKACFARSLLPKEEMQVNNNLQVSEEISKLLTEADSFVSRIHELVLREDGAKIFEQYLRELQTTDNEKFRRQINDAFLKIYSLPKRGFVNFEEFVGVFLKFKSEIELTYLIGIIPKILVKDCYEEKLETKTSVKEVEDAKLALIENLSLDERIDLASYVDKDRRTMKQLAELSGYVRIAEFLNLEQSEEVGSKVTKADAKKLESKEEDKVVDFKGK